MARKRTTLSDYNRMGTGFPYIRTFDSGVTEHGMIYAHDNEDARKRLMTDEVMMVVLLDGKRRN